MKNHIVPVKLPEVKRMNEPNQIKFSIVFCVQLGPTGYFPRTFALVLLHQSGVSPAILPSAESQRSAAVEAVSKPVAWNQ